MSQPYHLLPRIASTLAEEWLAMGLEHHVAGRFAEAEQAYLKGLRVDPANAPLINNWGVMAAQQNNPLMAEQRLSRALLMDDTNATIWYNHAFALMDCDRQDEAAASMRKSLDLMESADAWTGMGMILTACARAAEAVECYDKALDKVPTHPMASYNAIFARTLTHTTPEEAYKARQRWHKEFAYKGEKLPHANDKTPDRKLRVGYVGGDFKMHSAAFLFGTVILSHDREKVEPYCYMSMRCDPAQDGKYVEFQDKTNWRDITDLDDAAADRRIRDDGIDILVELAGHTGGNRLALFTRKPAPVQCHAWGFAHGTGCPEIDYFLADSYAIPQKERKYFAEQIWDLPAIVGFTPPDYGQSGTSPAPVSRDGTFTFGVFGRFEKYSPQSLEAWRQILDRTPNSRLFIKDLMTKRPNVVRAIRQAMHGIDPKRILFLQDCSHTEQMLAYQTVDLALDTFPHTGGVTALEMFYMGVPVVTLYNGQVGGRTTSVALKAIGRGGWIADSVEDYADKAVAAAADRAVLGDARSKLREELLKSPLCNPRYVRSVEDAYRQMWWRYCGVKEKGKKEMAG